MGMAHQDGLLWPWDLSSSSLSRWVQLSDSA